MEKYKYCSTTKTNDNNSAGSSCRLHSFALPSHYCLTESQEILGMKWLQHSIMLRLGLSTQVITKVL